MNNIKQYNPQKPLLIFADNSVQKIKATNTFDFVGSISKNIDPLQLYSSDSLDTAWDSNNIYFCNSSDNRLYKLDENGEVINSIQLSNPTLVSVIQGSENPVGYQDVNEIGAWVVDGTTLLKLNSDLETLNEIDGLKCVRSIVSTSDGGCFVADDYFQMIIQLNSEGQHISYLPYSDFLITAANERLFSIKVDGNGDIWALSNVSLYKVSFNDDGSRSFSFYVNLSSLIGIQYKHVSLDIDRWGLAYEENESSSSFSFDGEKQQNVYVASGNGQNTTICKFGYNGTLLLKKEHLNVGFPIAIKVAKGKFAKSLFLLQSQNEKNLNIDICDETLEMSSSSTQDLSSSSNSSEVFSNNKLWMTSSQYNAFFVFDIDTNTVTQTNVPFSSPTWTPNPSYGPESVASYRIQEDNANYIINPDDKKLYFNNVASDVTMDASPFFPIDSVYTWLNYSGFEKAIMLTTDINFLKELWVCAGNKIGITTIANVYYNAFTLSASRYILTLIPDDSSVMECTGIAMHPNKEKVYFSTRDAIYWADALTINLDNVSSTVYCYKIANKDALMINGIQDICFMEDESLIAIDSYVYDSSHTRTTFYTVNYNLPTVTYNNFATINFIGSFKIESISSNSGLV